MTDSFEAWINGMTEEQYTDWIEDKATEKQEEKALNIRTPLSESEMSQIEREQEYSEETSNIKQVDDIVYDNRDLPPITRTITIEIPRDNSPIRVLPQREGTRQPIQTAQLPRTTQQPTMQQPKPIQQRKSISQRIYGGLSRITSIFRRRK